VQGPKHAPEREACFTMHCRVRSQISVFVEFVLYFVRTSFRSLVQYRNRSNLQPSTGKHGPSAYGSSYG